MDRKRDKVHALSTQIYILNLKHGIKIKTNQLRMQTIYDECTL